MKFDRFKLIKLVKDSGYKTKHIAQIAGIHRSYLWMILNGTRIPSEQVIAKLYELLT